MSRAPGNPGRQTSADPVTDAWRPFIETSARLQTLLDDDLRRHCGMSLSDYHILLILHECPDGRARMRELSHRMVFSTSRLSYQIDVMVRRGWLSRAAVPEDRRGSYAVLTDDGRAAFTAAAHDHGTAVRRLYTPALTAEDGAALGDLMRTLATHLDDLEGETPR